MSWRTARDVAVHAPDAGIDADLVLRAARALSDGQVIAIPTDTVYGLAAAIDRPDAIARLYAIKGRPAEKAIPVLIADPADAYTLTPRLSATAVRLARVFWPGALTLVVPALPGLPPGVTTTTSGGIETVAVRAPASPATRAIIAAAGGALAVTSANRSGAAPALDARDVHRLGLPQPLLIVDGGRVTGGMPSTIVDARDERLEILREGAITASAITAALADIEPMSGDGTPAGYDQRRIRQREDNDSPEATS